MGDNVLWIFCEDLSPWFSCYGDQTVPTPHLDRLAAEGVVFERCYTPAPVCSPARSGVITGCWPASIGVHQHVSSRAGMPQIELPEPVVPLPRLFREAGWFTYNYGKDDYNFSYRREDLYAGAHEVKGFYGCQYADFAMKDLEAEWSYWRRGNGKPFFGQIGLWAGKTSARVAEGLDPAQVMLPKCYPDTASFRRQMARHYDQIRTTDYQVGRILDELERDGLRERTWIFFFSDHGYDLLRHKGFCYEGGLHVPLIVVPPRGRRARGSEGETRRSDLVSSVDVAATSLVCAGLEVPDWMESHDLFGPERREFVVSGKDRGDGTVDWVRTVRTERYRYVRNYWPERPLMQPQYRSGTDCFQDYMSGLLNGDAAYFASSKRMAEEFFDCKADPDEVRNVAENKEHEEQLMRHREILEQWVQQTGDRGGQREPEGQYDWLLRQWGQAMCWGPEYAGARRRAGF